MVKTNMLTAKNRQGFVQGFTLIELMAVVAVLGILLAIAVPNYYEYITKARRTEAQSDMMQIRLGLEKWRANNSTYTSTINQTTVGFTDANDYYNYAITGAAAGDSPTATVFVIRATAQGSQATKDAACTPLTLNQSGTKGPASCWKK